MERVTISDEDRPNSRGRFFESASGIVILVIDNLVFGTDVLSGMLEMVPLAMLAFVVTLVAVYAIQRRRGRDSRLQAGLKAGLAAILAGIPTSIAGTVLGTWILWSSGLRDR